MPKNLKEAQLPESFCRQNLLDVQKLIHSSTSFSVVGLPAMGISIFLRYLCTQNLGLMVHVDIYELQSQTPLELFRLLLRQLGVNASSKSDAELISLCRRQLEKLVRINQRIVIVFNRFDSLQKCFSRSLFANLRSLIDVDKEKIVIVFAANRPLVEEFPAVLEGGNLGKFSVTYFLPPYSPADLMSLLKLNSPEFLHHPRLDEVVALSGGHYQLLLLLLKSDYLPTQFLEDPAIDLQLQHLWNYLNFPERKQVRKIALEKVPPKIDKFLLDIGYVVKNGWQYHLLTPLLASYIKSHLRLKLPRLENQLYQLLKSQEGKVISKEKIFESLWVENSDPPTDWALDALIYRLRRNPTFKASGYEIESQKKVGYLLIKT